MHTTCSYLQFAVLHLVPKLKEVVVVRMTLMKTIDVNMLSTGSDAVNTTHGNKEEDHKENFR